MHALMEQAKIQVGQLSLQTPKRAHYRVDEPYVEDVKTSAHVWFGGARWRAGDTNGPGRRTELSSGQADVPRGWADALNMSNDAERLG